MQREAYPLTAKQQTLLVSKLEEWHIPWSCHKGKEMLTSIAAANYCGLRNGTATSMLPNWVTIYPETRTGDKAGTLTVPKEGISADDDGFVPKTESSGRAVPVSSKWTDYSRGVTFDVDTPRKALQYINLEGGVELGIKTSREALQGLCRQIELDNPDLMPEDADKADSLFGRGYSYLSEYKYPRSHTAGGRYEKVPRIYMHDLRASWCVHLLRGSGDESLGRYQIRDLGGWSNIDMIDQYASHIDLTGNDFDNAF